MIHIINTLLNRVQMIRSVHIRKPNALDDWLDKVHHLGFKCFKRLQRKLRCTPVLASHPSAIPPSDSRSSSFMATSDHPVVMGEPWRLRLKPMVSQPVTSLDPTFLGFPLKWWSQFLNGLTWSQLVWSPWVSILHRITRGEIHGLGLWNSLYYSPLVLAGRSTFSP